MNGLSDFMTRDHQRLDTIFEDFRNTKYNDFGRAKDLFIELKVGMQRHIIWEEEIIFPVYEQTMNTKHNGSTIAMRAEHEAIKEFLQEICLKLQEGNPQTDISDAGLVDALLFHNPKEEDIVYRWLNDNLTGEKTKPILVRMKATSSEKYSYERWR